MKRQPRQTKRERKANAGPGPAAAPQQHDHDHEHAHIHCISCGRHLDENEFDEPATATVLTCLHGSHFPTCVEHAEKSKELIAEHDRTNTPVKTAGAWH